MSTAFETDSEFAVVLLTQDGTIVDAHPTCFESLGWKREELAGKDVGELLQSDRDSLMQQLLQSRDEEIGGDGQTSFSLRILARRRDDTSFPARIVVRRFDQTGCCTAAFYRVNPYNDTDTAPTVRPEEIELAMRGNGAVENSASAAKEQKPKFRWRNARLLFGSKPQPQAAPTPAPAVPATSAPLVQPIRPAPKLNPQIPENLFQRKVAPAALPPKQEAPPEPETPVAEEQALTNPELEETPSLTPARDSIGQEEGKSNVLDESEERTGDADGLTGELEQEREERRRLEQRAAALTAQVSALHLQVSENLEIESRNQKKVSTLEEQLREARSQVTQLKAELSSERQKSTSIEQKVEAANEVATHITTQLEALKVVHDALSRTQAECEEQLKAVSGELKEAQEALAMETAKRQELELALSRTQQERADSERTLKLELSKLETALKEKELEFKEMQTKHAQEVLRAQS